MFTKFSSSSHCFQRRLVQPRSMLLLWQKIYVAVGLTSHLDTCVCRVCICVLRGRKIAEATGTSMIFINERKGWTLTNVMYSNLNLNLYSFLACMQTQLVLTSRTVELNWNLRFSLPVESAHWRPIVSVDTSIQQWAVSPNRIFNFVLSNTAAFVYTTA